MTGEVRAITPVSRPPDATVRPPGSKSLTNRALLLAASARGRSTIRGILRADDTEAMAGALRALGARIDLDGTTATVTPGIGVGIGSGVTIDARLSGTTARFILPVAASTGVPVTVDGGPPLRRRPMGPILEALRSLGVEVAEHGEPGCLPVTVTGTEFRGGTVTVSAAQSSQLLSGLLLVGPALERGLVVGVEGEIAARPFVDLTVGSMRAFGATVDEVQPGRFEIAPGGLVGRTYDVEPDATAATYFAGAAAITGGRVTISGLGRESVQGDVGFFEVLERMGARIDRGIDATVVTGGTLHGIDVDLSSMPDTAQTLAAVAVFADSPTTVRGVGFIRGHETDRIAAVVTELRRLGVDARATDDGFTVVPGPIRPGVVHTYQDHRMAMSFALIGLVAPGVTIAEPGVVAKTYPEYFVELTSLGPS